MWDVSCSKCSIPNIIVGIIGKSPATVLQTIKVISTFFDTVFRIDSSEMYF